VDFLVSSFAAALRLIGSFSPDVVDAVRTSLSVSAGATVFAALFGIPVGLAVGLSDSRLKGLAVTALNTLMAVPTVVVGLLVYGFLSRQGPLGALGAALSPTAIVIGGTLLASPIVANYTLASVRGADARILPRPSRWGPGRSVPSPRWSGDPVRGVRRRDRRLRAGRRRRSGVAMMLGGNIRGYTRTMTTAIALETSKGEFSFGMALGIVLMTVALIVNLFLSLLQRR